jgi:hypothetical protein
MLYNIRSWTLVESHTKRQFQRDSKPIFDSKPNLFQTNWQKNPRIARLVLVSRVIGNWLLPNSHIPTTPFLKT